MTRSGCLYVPDFPAWALDRMSPGEGPVVVLVNGQAFAWTRGTALREIRPGDREDRVRRLCPEARIRVRDTSIEAAAWDEVLGRLHAVTPFIASSPPPFAYFRSEEMDELHTLARDLGIRIGLGTDRATARLAAVRAAGRHLLRVPAERHRSFLDRFPVQLMTELGYPDGLPEHLLLFGYASLGSIVHLTRRHLEAQFGPEGTSLYALLHPDPDPPVPPYVPPPAIVAEFEPECEIDPGEAGPIIRLLARQGSEVLGDRRTQRLSLELHVVGTAAPRRASRLLPEPHGDPEAIVRFVLRLLDEAALPDDRVDRIVLRMEALRRPSVHQVSMFDSRPAVLGAVRRVHRRYPEAIRRAVHRAHVLFPEDSLLLEPYDPEGTGGEPTDLSPGASRETTGPSRSGTRRRPT